MARRTLRGAERRAETTVVLTGSGLTLDQLIAVARHGEQVALAPDAVARMRRARDVVDRAFERGDPVYGLTTAVGVLKRVSIGADDVHGFDRRLIRSHLVGQGPPAPDDVVRATMVRLANGFASGWVGVRPELAQRVVDALNQGLMPPVRVLGSIGQSDLAPMADLAARLVEGFELAPGEGLSLLNNNSFSTGWAALALADATRLERAMEAAGALTLEG